jgi:site-specific DNA-methyltransferase (adenine-specific)
MINHIKSERFFKSDFFDGMPSALYTYKQPLPFNNRYCRDQVSLFLGNSLQFYETWSRPTVIIADGPYGLGSYPGDPPTPEFLADWYEPHFRWWTQLAKPSTTLWFWNSELGWANVHSKIQEWGWEFRNCHIWNKGIGHIAGNCNTQTIRKFPVTTEVCVQYVRNAEFTADGQKLTMRDWLRYEWKRSGLPFSKTNEACGTKNAATRKYFTKDHLWYYPPPEAFEQIQQYANQFGQKEGRPYFSTDGVKPLTAREWEMMRPRFYCKNGITNVWEEPAVRGAERLKTLSKCIHNNQKPLKLLERCIEASSDIGDVVWEPFGGLCSVAIAAHRLKRIAFSAEINPDYYDIAVKRLENYDVF